MADRDLANSLRSTSVVITYRHGMAWQSTRMKHTQRKDRVISLTLPLGNMHGRCLFHGQPAVWCQIELHLRKQFHFLLLWHTFKCFNTQRTTEEELSSIDSAGTILLLKNFLKNTKSIEELWKSPFSLLCCSCVSSLFATIHMSNIPCLT